jgi:glycosyltransferase involved in cell wall biosynthesis
MKVSIITIVRNGESVIERTMLSVFAQTYADIEYIVVDGASTDGTMKVVQQYSNRINKIISEPDKGISDAWNKGIQIATGDIIGLINAGDEYMPDTVRNAMQALQHHPGVVFGDTELVDDVGHVLHTNVGKWSLWRHSGGLGFYHPSCFASASVYRKIGGFELGYRYAMDADWLLRAYFAGISCAHAPLKVRMLSDGISVQNRFRAYGEYLHTLSAHSKSPTTVYLSMLVTAVRGLVKAAFKGRAP